MIRSKQLLQFAALAAAGMMSCVAGHAQIQGALWQNQSTAAGDALLSYGDPSSGSYLGAPDATFSSTGFNYNPADSNPPYTPASFLNSPTFNNQSVNFSTPNPGYGPNAGLDNTYFYFTGTLFLNAGANTFVVGHDDGLQLNIDGIGLVVDQPGPTALAETPFTVTAPSAGNYTFELSYGECCGPPASLVWQINQRVVGAPDAASSLTLLGMSLGGLAAFARRMRK